MSRTFADLARNYEDAKHKFIDTKYKFILVELDLAFTFFEMAESDPSAADRAKRNLEHARQAFNSAKHFLKNANLTPEMRAAIDEKLKRLPAISNPSRDSHTPSPP